MRRTLIGTAAFLAMTGTLLVLPVYASPAPEAVPVEASVETVALGSVTEPEGDAVVATDGEVVAVAEEPASTPSPSTGAPSPTTPSDAPAEVGEDAPVTSGEEEPGVPALTVSRPDTDVFSTVGVTWALDEGVTGVTARVRVQDAGGRWGRWTDLEVEDMETSAPAEGDARGGTAPYWTGDAYGLEAVVQAADGTTPRDVQVQLIDPGESPADVVPGPPQASAQAGAVMAMPAIYSRAQWGADEHIRFWDPEYAPTLKAATIHHTADKNGYAAADVAGILRSTYVYHTQSRGWGDIGYNVIVDRFGRAWEGRYGGLSSTVIGAHAGGFNTSTFGVSMLGNYDLVDTPRAMLDTVAHVIAWKFSLYHVDPRGTTSLTSGGGGTARYAAGTRVTVPTIFAHRDVGFTACPGQYGYAHMGDIRSLVSAYMADLSRWELPGAYTQNPDGSMSTVYRGDPWDVPLMCDWNGDGVATLGIWRKGRFVLYDTPARSEVPRDFWWALSTDTPICGDWDGDGTDTIGVWRAGWFYLKNSNTPNGPWLSIPFGQPADTPVVGDWNGDGKDTVGVHRGAWFHWGNNPTGYSWDGQLSFGNATDLPVLGDWNGDGRDTVGVWRDGVFYLSERTSGRWYDTIWWGHAFDVPVTGAFAAGAPDGIGVARGY